MKYHVQSVRNHQALETLEMIEKEFERPQNEEKNCMTPNDPEM